MANHAPTTPTVVPHPAARAHRARALKRERLRPHRERLEAKITAALEQLEDLRQAFVARLDALHGDCDLEDPGDLEPSLAFPEGCYRTDSVLWAGSSGDREEQVDHEHTLGRSENIDQTRYDPPSEDAEYDLGAANPSCRLSQIHWGERNEGWGGGDAEEQCEDEGQDSDREPDCDDEGHEQAKCHSEPGVWPPKFDPARPGAHIESEWA